jgi:AcrR family transcriptional regulator
MYGVEHTNTMASHPAPKAERPPLTRELILETGMRLIDAEGVDALSIRRLGDELGYSPMLIYRHVRDKDDLLDQIVTLALESLTLDSDPQAPWKDRLLATVTELSNGLHDHPGVTEIIMRRPPPLPAFDRFRETMLQALHDSGLDEPDAVDALTAIVCYLLGYAHAARARGRTDTPGEAERLRNLSPRQFPRLSESADIYAGHLTEEAFQKGVRALLTGLTTR